MGTPPVGHSTASVGTGLTALGDVDGDGVDDLAVGCWHTAPGSILGPGVWILLMNADGTVKAEQLVGTAAGDLPFAYEGWTGVGEEIAALGDLDDDGVPDLAVGGPWESSSGPNRGNVYVLFLDPDGTVKSSTKISDGVGGFGGTLDNGDLFGHDLVALGDLDGDGNTELAVAAINDDDGGASIVAERGAVYVLFLDDDGTVKSETKISETTGGFGGALADGERFGGALAAPGDIDGDGIPDLVATVTNLAIVDTPSGTSATIAPAFWVLFLDTDGTVQSEHLIDPSAGDFTGSWGEMLSGGNYDYFAKDIAGIGDVNGDGIPDLAVGEAEDDDTSAGAVNRGAVWILFLDTDGSLKRHVKLSDVAGNMAGALHATAASRFGWSVTGRGDTDGDGLLEIAVGAPYGAATANVALIELSGPPALSPFVAFPDAVAGRTRRAAVLDLRLGGGDDALDDPIVVVPKLDGSTVELLQVVGAEDGQLSFQEGVVLDVGAEPTHASSADFDGDGLPDLAVANAAGAGGGGSFSVLLAQDLVGQPPFAAQTEFALTLDASPVVVATADLDGADGPDVLLGGAAGVTVFLNDGAGGFTESGFTAVADVTDLAVGALDADADLDVLVAQGDVAPGPGQGSGGVTVLLGDGGGGLSSSGTFATGQAVASVLLVDADGGGDLDAMLAVHELDSGPGGEPQGVLRLFTGDGLGGFTASGAFTGHATPTESGVHPTWGLVGDIDGDAFDDLVYTSADNVSHPPGTFDAQQPPIVLTVLRNDQAGGFDVSVVSTPYVGKAVAAGAADVTGGAGPSDFSDGNLDVFVAFTTDAFAGQPLVEGGPGLATYGTGFVGDGAGGFAPTSASAFSGGDSAGAPAAGDVNNDGADGGGGGLDLVVPDAAGNALAVLLGDGTGDFPDPAIVTTGIDDEDGSGLPLAGDWAGGPRSVLLGHLDSDGDVDAVVLNRWDDATDAFDPVSSLSLLLGNGSGGFVKVQSVSLGQGGEAALGDVAGSSALDVVVTQRAGAGADVVHVYAGAGDGTVSGPQVLAPPAGEVLAGGLALADVDGDLDLDVVVVSADDVTDEGSVLVFTNASGVFTPVLHGLGGAEPGPVAALDVGDVTGDGEDDVVVGSEDGGLLVAAGDGLGAFTPVVLADSSVRDQGGGAVSVADVDGNGIADVVGARAAGGGGSAQAYVGLLRAQGGGAFTATQVAGLSAVGPHGAMRPLLADLDDDGAVDLVLAHGGAGAVTVLRNGLNGFSTYNTGKPGTGAITPRLEGKGYTTPGGALTIAVTQTVGGTWGLFQVGLIKLETPPLAVDLVVLEFLVPLSGTMNAPGAGAFITSTSLPPDPAFVGAELYMQIIVADPAIILGVTPVMGLSLSNGLEMRIVE